VLEAVVLERVADVTLPYRVVTVRCHMYS
jgi:hypothetical protein